MAESNQYKLSMRLAGSGNPWQVLRRTDGGPGITTNMTNPNESIPADRIRPCC